MIFFELYSGPNSGKTTAAAALFVGLKNAGVRVELVGENARERIYNDATRVFQDNQILCTGEQLERVLRLRRHKCEVLISDSPLVQGIMYAKQLPYYDELLAIIRKCEATFWPDVKKVYVHRMFPFDFFGRIQKNEAEAKGLDRTSHDLGAPFWLEIEGNVEGQQTLVKRALELLDMA